jgi:xanthosine utilization system XapX-like protein
MQDRWRQGGQRAEQKHLREAPVVVAPINRPREGIRTMSGSESVDPRSRRTATTRSAPRARRADPPVVEVFFMLGAILILVGFLYSLVRSWPSFDPLALAMLVGIGLLLVVVCERMRLVLQELRVLTSLMRTAIADAEKEPPK